MLETSILKVLMYAENSTGPKILPCGTEKSIGMYFEYSFTYVYFETSGSKICVDPI